MKETFSAKANTANWALKQELLEVEKHHHAEHEIKKPEMFWANQLNVDYVLLQVLDEDG